MADFPSVLVIFNEPVLAKDHPDAAAEFDVIEATELVVKILQNAGFPTRQLGFSYEPRVLLDELRDRRPNVVFNMFEGLATQTATEISVVSLLEWLNVPCTGSPAFALALGRDKIRTKYLLQGAGVPTAEFQVIERLPIGAWPFAWPAIVKPALQDCSVGIEQGSVVTSQHSLEQRVAYTLERFGAPVLIERFIFGRELHANIIEEAGEAPDMPNYVCVPLCEIRFTSRPGENYWPIYSYEAKWNAQSDEFKTTPQDTVVRLPADLQERIDKIAIDAYKLVGLRDCGRIDFRLTDDGQPFVLEVNPNPYLHGEAIIDGLKTMGRSHPQFIENMVWAAWKRGGGS